MVLVASRPKKHLPVKHKIVMLALSSVSTSALALALTHALALASFIDSVAF